MSEKPTFNLRELSYLHDTDFLLTKRKISQQVQQLLALTEQKLVSFVQENNPPSIPEDCLKAAGKISKGENYRGLPYLVLDYPRLFSKEDIFAFRTMCWWGHFFSCTLHLQGESLETLRPPLRKTLLSLHTKLPDTYICVHKSPWEYHFGEDNYQLLETMGEDKIAGLLEKEFIKISRKIPLNKYQQIPEFSLQSFCDFLALLKP